LIPTPVGRSQSAFFDDLAVGHLDAVVVRMNRWEEVLPMG
jgi:hypothetical protein